MMINRNIAGVVVLYNPSSIIYKNLASYLNQIDRLFVVDNSEIYNHDLIQRLKETTNIVYVDNLGNKGIGSALNVGISEALKAGYSWSLTMDQDTILPEHYIDNLVAAVKHLEAKEVGIIAPSYMQRTNERLPLEFILITMTSGNLLNLDLFSEIGPFMEELFIDHVDHEYCLRLNSLGYKVVQVNTIILNHIPGNRRKVNFFGFRFEFSTHSPLRLYYFMRNGLFVSKLYKDNFPQFRRTFKVLFLKELVKLPFGQNVLAHLKMIYFAFRHYHQGRMGKYSHR